MARLHIPLEVVAEIIELVAACYPLSLLASCALVSHEWNIRSARHLYLAKIVLRIYSPISWLPIELLYRIIDLVAESHPDSLPTCALVSQQWNLRSTFHLQRLKKTFRHIKLTSIPEVHGIFDIAKGNAGFGQWPTSLQVSPDPAASTSYIPFLHLSSRILPNVNRLVWGETLRWIHYPPLYNNGVVGSSFHAVVTLDLHCCFKSAQDLFRIVRSFKNLEQVRLLHPDPFQPPIAPTQVVPHLDIRTPLEIKLQKPLRWFEIPFAVIRNVLEIFGDYIMNLSIRCPPASTLSTLEVTGEHPPFPSSFHALKAVKLTILIDPSNPAHTGLQNLCQLVVAPIHKVNVRYSLTLICCTQHSTVGYRVEGISRTSMSAALRTPAMISPLKSCPACGPGVTARENGPRLSPSTPIPVVSESPTPPELESELHPEYGSVTLLAPDRVQIRVPKLRPEWSKARRYLKPAHFGAAPSRSREAGQKVSTHEGFQHSKRSKNSTSRRSKTGSVMVLENVTFCTSSRRS